ncbi:MAG: hypothetical protein HY314_03540 [Acidobacteria bacterium]|nr:hypothetical protein [Acidobacteriota bacterium]
MTRLLPSLRSRFQPTLVVLLAGAVLATGPAFVQTVLAEHKQDKEPSLNLAQTAFTYQGQLKDGSAPASGAYDFKFTLYAAQTGGDELGSVSHEGLVLANGSFKVQLDFGGVALVGGEGWLEIAVRPGSSTDPYTVLAPRQKLTPTPFAILAQEGQWSLIGVPIGFANGIHNGMPVDEKLAPATKSASGETSEGALSLSKSGVAEAQASDNVEATPAQANCLPLPCNNTTSSVGTVFSITNTQAVRRFLPRVAARRSLRDPRAVRRSMQYQRVIAGRFGQHPRPFLARSGPTIQGLAAQESLEDLSRFSDARMRINRGGGLFR